MKLTAADRDDNAGHSDMVPPEPLPLRASIACIVSDDRNWVSRWLEEAPESLSKRLIVLEAAPS